MGLGDTYVGNFFPFSVKNAVISSVRKANDNLRELVVAETISLTALNLQILSHQRVVVQLSLFKEFRHTSADVDLSILEIS